MSSPQAVPNGRVADALNLGWTADELREALLQIGGYAGFPAAHEALDVLSEIVTQR